MEAQIGSPKHFNNLIRLRSCCSRSGNKIRYDWNPKICHLYVKYVIFIYYYRRDIFLKVSCVVTSVISGYQPNKVKFMNHFIFTSLQKLIQIFFVIALTVAAGTFL